MLNSLGCVFLCLVTSTILLSQNLSFQHCSFERMGSQYNEGYMLLYHFTVFPRLSVISGPSENQTSVYLLPISVKVIWAFPKTNTPTVEIQV